MKKVLMILAMSALVLAACSEKKAPSWKGNGKIRVNFVFTKKTSAIY